VGCVFACAVLVLALFAMPEIRTLAWREASPSAEPVAGGTGIDDGAGR